MCHFLCTRFLFDRCLGRATPKEAEVLAYSFLFNRLIADTVGTSLMEHIAELTHLHDEIHTVTGTIAILLMFVHALWAIWTYVKGSAKAKKHFNRFSIVVWCIWLIPYLIGVYMGMRLHP